MPSDFEWDTDKATGNLIKHGISFEEASTVFSNPLASIFDDDDHSIDENREIIIGHSDKGRVLITSFTVREGTVRIISSRKASTAEARKYEDHIH